MDDTGILLLLIAILSVIIFIMKTIGRPKKNGVYPPEEVEVFPEADEEEEQEEEEEPEPSGEEEPEESRIKRKRMAPLKRGGRPRVTEKTKVERKEEFRQYQWKPEIVCWQRERLWLVGVEMSEDMLEKDIEVFQNDLSLTQDEFDESLWVLKKLNVSVKIQCEENELFSIPLNKPYLLFKLSGSDQNKGCCVRYPSFGSYFVIVPETWRRDIDLSGSPPVSPQPVSLKGYRGHFFNIFKDDERKIAFNNVQKESIIIESEATRFEIVGNLLDDSNEKFGPLFGDGPIKIKSLNSREWIDVGTLVIGEEGSGRGRWRTSFSPDKNESMQGLPSEVLSRKGGWYFIRFYNENDDLIESLDFRFVNGLKGIKISQSSVLPSEEGHDVVYVVFSHNSNLNIKPKFDIGEDIEISSDANTTTITIPPRDHFDKTSWSVGLANGQQVEVNILVERVWWNIGAENEPPSKWKDKPIILSRDDFAPTSNKSIYLRFPKPRWIDEVSVGFEQNRVSLFSISVEEKTIGIPLRSFGDYAEVENEDQEAHLIIWLNRGTETYESKLALLPSNNQHQEPEKHPSIEPDGIGYGRKRRAIAKASLIRGSHQITVNDKPLWEYFDEAPEKAKMFMRRLMQIEAVSKMLLDFQIIITVEGSSPNTMQQAKAATHALARALMDYNWDLKQLLKRMNDFGGVRVQSLPSERKK